MRVRGFTQDDAHHFCRPDQLDAEIDQLLIFTLFMLRSFGFTEFDIYLSTRPEHYVGSLENWERATDALRAGLEKAELEYQIDPAKAFFTVPKSTSRSKIRSAAPGNAAPFRLISTNPSVST